MSVLWMRLRLLCRWLCCVCLAGLLWGCPAVSRVRKELKQGMISSARYLHQVRFDVGKSSQVFQGLLILGGGRFFMFAHEGPMKLFGAVYDGHRLAGVVYFPGLKRLIPSREVAIDVWAVYMAGCGGKGKMAVCRVGGMTISERYEKGKLREKVVEGCYGTRRILYEDWQTWGGGRRARKIVLTRGDRYRLEIQTNGYQSGIMVDSKLFLPRVGSELVGVCGGQGW